MSRRDVRVVADVEGGAERLQGVAIAVLPHERVAQPLPGLEAAGIDGEGGARLRLRPRPVARVQVDLHEGQHARVDEGWTSFGALEIGDGLRELALAQMAIGGAEQDRLEQVAEAALLGMAGQQVLRHLHVRRGQGRGVRELPHEGVGVRAVGVGHLAGIELQLARGRRDGMREAGRRSVGDVRRGLARRPTARPRRAGAGLRCARSQSREPTAPASTSRAAIKPMARPLMPPRGGGAGSAEDAAGGRAAGAARVARALATITPQRGQAASVTAGLATTGAVHGRIHGVPMVTAGTECRP